ncbi:MAG: uridine kinase [bacterium]
MAGDPAIRIDTLDAHLDAFADAIAVRRRQTAPIRRSFLVALTGIDGSGKSFVARDLARRLEARNINVAGLSADLWLNLPAKRFDALRPAANFYERAIRFESLFRDVVLPLQATSSCHAVIDRVDETATAFRRHAIDFEDVDVILLEGIFLLKRTHRRHFDASAWLACTFETALERAIHRRQEALSRAATVRAYETIYFAAQRIHFAEDDPRATASTIIPNDPRLTAETDPAARAPV